MINNCANVALHGPSEAAQSMCTSPQVPTSMVQNRGGLLLDPYKATNNVHV
jgi:hypothetical protein